MSIKHVINNTCHLILLQTDVINQLNMVIINVINNTHHLILLQTGYVILNML